MDCNIGGCCDGGDGNVDAADDMVDNDDADAVCNCGISDSARGAVIGGESAVVITPDGTIAAWNDDVGVIFPTMAAAARSNARAESRSRDCCANRSRYIADTRSN